VSRARRDEALATVRDCAVRDYEGEPAVGSEARVEARYWLAQWSRSSTDARLAIEYLGEDAAIGAYLAGLAEAHADEYALCACGAESLPDDDARRCRDCAHEGDCDSVASRREDHQRGE